MSKPGEMLSAMLKLTVTAHDGQYDKGGKPYILHPLKVMHWLRTEDEHLQCIALGHDVVEDCGVTYRQLYEAGMSARVVDGIHALTKTTGEDYEEYKAKVKRNPDAVLVKMQDLRHNSDIRRLRGVTDKDVERIKRYHAFYLELKAIAAAGSPA